MVSKSGCLKVIAGEANISTTHRGGVKAGRRRRGRNRKIRGNERRIQGERKREMGVRSREKGMSEEGERRD